MCYDLIINLATRMDIPSSSEAGSSTGAESAIVGLAIAARTGEPPVELVCCFFLIKRIRLLKGLTICRAPDDGRCEFIVFE